MPKFESLRPVGVMISTLGFQVRDAGSNTVLVHFIRIAPEKQQLQSAANKLQR